MYVWFSTERNAGIRENWDWNQAVSFIIKKGIFRQFGHVQQGVDPNWVKCCMSTEVDETRLRLSEKTWCDCAKEDMKSLGVSQENASL